MLYRSATMQLSLKLLNSKPVGPLCNHSKVREECMPDVPFGSVGTNEEGSNKIWILIRGSRPARKLPAFRRDFHLFSLFDEERNADLKAGFQFGWLGHSAARRIALDPGLGVSNV